MHIQFRFHVERWDYLKGSPEQVTRLARSQIYQKGDKPYYKELIFMLYKVNGSCLFDGLFFFFQTSRKIFQSIKVH